MKSEAEMQLIPYKDTSGKFGVMNLAYVTHTYADENNVITVIFVNGFSVSLSGREALHFQDELGVGFLDVTKYT